MECFEIDKCRCSQDRAHETGRAKRSVKLFRTKDRTKILRIDEGVVPIPPFRIDVGASGEGVGFGAEPARAESDEKVEGGEVFGPAGLTSGEHFSRSEILQVFVISNDVYDVF